jgi:uncharacterized protein YecE (DUF72 family)
MKLHVGCAMWTHAAWQGTYLPRSLSPGERLSAYATWCNAVEGNTTFYATPTLETVMSWAAQTTADFRFILKLPKVNPARTVTGWQPWLGTVASWLREGRSPTVFIHTPDNVDALKLARQFHDEVRARVPEVAALPRPAPAGPPALF